MSENSEKGQLQVPTTCMVTCSHLHDHMTFQCVVFANLAPVLLDLVTVRHL